MIKISTKILTQMALFLLFWNVSFASNTIDISGKWRIQTKEKSGVVTFPGDIESQGYGEKPSLNVRRLSGHQDPLTKPRLVRFVTNEDNFRWPYTLQPDLHFRGTSVVSKDVEIPESFLDKHLTLYIERAHIKTTLFVNEQKVGDSAHLGVPHTYDISDFVKKGKNTLKIEIDNDIPLVYAMGQSAHAVGDETLGNWNGLVGAMFIKAQPKLWIDDFQIYPSEDLKSAKVRVAIGDKAKDKIEKSLTLKIKNNYDSTEIKKEIKIPANENSTEFTVDMKNAKTWSEFGANLQFANLTLKSAMGEDSKNIQFGMRYIKCEDEKILLNGDRIFLRTTLDCGPYPLTGYAPTDKEEWLRIIRACKSYGMNGIRFHSQCPPEAGFLAADEEGFYFQVENGIWGQKIGESEELAEWIGKETDAQLKYYGNHPSFMMYSQCNEPSNSKGTSNPALVEFLEEWVKSARDSDGRHIYTTGTGWPWTPVNDFMVVQAPRLRDVADMERCIVHGERPRTNFNYNDRYKVFSDHLKVKQPMISHETGQWCAYPDLTTIDKFSGKLKAKSHEVFVELIKEAHLEQFAKQFTMASGKLQVLMYKAEIEALHRSQMLSGYQLLDLHDFPGQGTAPVGVLDAFWNSKGYCSAEDYSRFANRVVPLAEFPKLICKKGDDIDVKILVSNYEQNDLKNAKVICELKDGKKIIFTKTFDCKSIERELSEIGELSIDTSSIKTPAALNFVVTVKSDGVKDYQNDWNVWVYEPQTVEIAQTDKVRSSETFDRASRKFVEDGGSLWLRIPGISENKFNIYFPPVFWTAAWRSSDTMPLMLGILCNPEHPAFKTFPTSYHSDFNWWEMVRNAMPIILTKGDAIKIDPIVRMIPDWFSPTNAGFVFEAKVGKGKVFVTNINFDAEGENLSLKQLESSFYNYIKSSDFKPTVELDVDEFAELVKINQTLTSIGAKVIAVSSENAQYPASNAIDTRPDTLWHTKFEGGIDPYPHFITIDLGKAIEIEGVRYMPRLEGEGGHGNWGIVEVYCSDDPADFDVPFFPAIMTHDFKGAKHEFTEARFNKPITTRYIKFKILSASHGGPFASAAEIDVIHAEK